MRAFPGLRRPALVLVVSPHDVLEPAALKQALRTLTIDAIQLRNNPDMPVPNSIYIKTATQLAAMRGRRGRCPLLILNAPYDTSFQHLYPEVADVFHYPERTIMDTAVADDLQRGPSIYGFSVHSVPSARRAIKLGASYLQVGTMFPTASHPEKKVVEGPALIHEIHKRFPNVPLIGIGGIDETNCAEVLAAGASGVSVIRAILAAKGPSTVAEHLRRELDTRRGD
ncbi:hypothetical protein SDRG_04288 [Saprolegnia diclina VS20]|uniref:Thiamine phosphate synthase/TenI domain-containing protein n=1 Tax=Saprolegnia diclina (strain VS20) TaxID=1156394 RepID=T0QX27_SAPDV|nr:hypothetical protein SDRG_04288 [Saprolegnia diclina VS20]EQC38585.1 hypothetical protein SDRG_04288 [Saprolegnia diclina VS20]|eukprot:XP_008608177.1 hypothetical protein SDRG_04288 [Saprolegnia diclina VS20]